MDLRQSPHKQQQYPDCQVHQSDRKLALRSWPLRAAQLSSVYHIFLHNGLSRRQARPVEKQSRLEWLEPCLAVAGFLQWRDGWQHRFWLKARQDMKRTIHAAPSQ